MEMKKILGIFICMLLIATTIPVTGQVTKNIIIKDNDVINPSSNGNTWKRTFGGDDRDTAWDGHQTSDGGYIVVGSTQSFGAGYDDIWLIKIDCYGNKEWDKTFGGPGNDWAYAVINAIDGGYIIAGHHGKHGVWLIKTNDLGELQWEKKYFSGGSLDVCQTDDGGYVVVGNFYDDKNLMKVDKDGNELWNKSVGEDYFPLSFQQTNEGGFIMIGGPYLIKTDSNGEQEWSVTFDSEMEGLDVLQNNDGGYTAVGYKGDWFESTGWMLRTDENGNIIGQKDYCGIKTYYGVNSLYQTNDGGYIITGRIRLDRLYVFPDICLWLAKTDEYGKIQWHKRFCGSYDPYDLGWTVQQTTDGGYFVVGSKYCRPIENHHRDIWLIKTDANGNVARSRATYNSLFLKFFEQFPLLQKLLLLMK